MSQESKMVQCRLPVRHARILYQMVASSQFHSGICEATGLVHLHHLAYSLIMCMGSLSSNVGLLMAFNKCWMSTIKWLLVTFHPPLIMHLWGLQRWLEVSEQLLLFYWIY